jgi:hypothetical protein
MKKKGGRDQRQHKASSREAISDAAARGFATAILPEAAGQFFPAAVPVGKSLFGQGIRPVQPATPGKKFIGSFV